MSAPGRVLLLFLDGVGVGPADASRNPFLRAELPTLRRLLDGEQPTLERPDVGGSDALAFALDATLGVEGTPQSGTGQTALLTGLNAPRIFGRHFGPWVPVRLRPVLEARSVLARATAAGLPTAFANAYPEGYPGDRSLRRVAGPPLAARAAGLLDRHHDALADGRAVASEIVNEGWRRELGHDGVPRVSSEEAGRNLARIAAGHRLTLYAHYATDLAGHRGGMEGGVAALERVDAFLAGVVDALPPDALLVVASDHGNLEDVRAEHTRNPALGLVRGPGAAAFRQGVRSLADVAGAVLRVLGILHGSEEAGAVEAPATAPRAGTTEDREG